MEQQQQLVDGPFLPCGSGQIPAARGKGERSWKHQSLGLEGLLWTGLNAVQQQGDLAVARGNEGDTREPCEGWSAQGCCAGCWQGAWATRRSRGGFLWDFHPSLQRSPLCPPGRRQGSRSASGDVAAPVCTAGESCGRRIKAQRWRSGTNSAASLSKGHTISTRKLYTSGPNEVRVGARQGTRSGLASASHSHQGELAKVFLYCTPSPAAWQPLTQSFLEPEAACLCFWFL